MRKRLQLSVLYKHITTFLQMHHQSIAHLAKNRSILRLHHTIMQLGRIFLQIKQLLASIMQIPNILHLAIGQPTPIIILRITRGMFQVDIFPPNRMRVLHQRTKRTPVHILRHRSPGYFQKGRKQVTQLHRIIQSETIREHSFHLLRPFHNIRDMRRALIGISLPPMVMVAQHIAMI